MTIYQPSKAMPNHLILRMRRVEACMISAPFGMLEEVRKGSPEVDGMRVWVGPQKGATKESVFIWIPVSLIGSITRATPGNPVEEDLQFKVAQYVAQHPDLERCFISPEMPSEEVSPKDGGAKSPTDPESPSE